MVCFGCKPGVPKTKRAKQTKSFTMLGHGKGQMIRIGQDRIDV